MMNRQKTIDFLKNNTFDLLVIGGGVTGVGIALDAQTRGLKTALIEKQDFAGGTSSRSTKLIHGGLRYLKQMDVKLVMEVGRERAIVHGIAPHLVHPDKMLLPLVEGGNYGKFLTSVGLRVYDFLAGVKRSEWRKMLSKEQTQAMEPLLREDILQGSGYYAEYRTDDARLTISLAKTARQTGGQIINYTQANDFVYEQGKVVGVKAQDTLDQSEYIIRAKQVVNAAGPWVDELRKKDNSLKGKRLHLTKGIHLVVPHDRFPVKHTVYFDNTDGRMIFAIPRGKITYVGTTDTNYKGDINQPLTTKEDMDYVLAAANYMFPSIKLEEKDVISSWAGLRPLIHQDGKSPSELSRKDEIFVSENGLISIAGGKLTGYRKMSERIINLVYRYLGLNPARCITEKLKLVGGNYENYQAVEDHVSQLKRKYPAILRNQYEAEYLVHNYGTEAETILEKVDLAKEPNPSIALALAELHYTVAYEMVQRVTDFFERRTGRLYFDIQSIAEVQEPLIQEMATLLQWDQKRIQEERDILAQAIHYATNFSEEKIETQV